MAIIYNVGSPCYALHYGPRREKDPRWVPAVVTKRFGTCSVNVRVFPRGGTWRRHVEQLRPRYVDQEDTDPGPVQIQTMEPVVQPCWQMVHLLQQWLKCQFWYYHLLGRLKTHVYPQGISTAPTILGGHPGDPFQGSRRFAPEEEHQG